MKIDEIIISRTMTENYMEDFLEALAISNRAVVEALGGYPQLKFTHGYK